MVFLSKPVNVNQRSQSSTQSVSLKEHGVQLFNEIFQKMDEIQLFYEWLTSDVIDLN